MTTITFHPRTKMSMPATLTMEGGAPRAFTTRYAGDGRQGVALFTAEPWNSGDWCEHEGVHYLALEPLSAGDFIGRSARGDCEHVTHTTDDGSRFVVVSDLYDATFETPQRDDMFAFLERQNERAIRDAKNGGTPSGD